MLSKTEVLSEIEKLLATKNLTLLSEYVASNPLAEDYCNQLLYSFANNIPRSDDLEKCEMLLKVGANPNYFFNNEDSAYYGSLLQAVASYSNGTLIEMLLSYGAKADFYVEPKLYSRELYKQIGYSDEKINEIFALAIKRRTSMSIAEKIEDMAKRRKLPVQIAFQDYKERLGVNPSESIKTCSLLAKATISGCGADSQIKNTLNKIYTTLKIEIAKAVVEASQTNRQLIIIVGEQHSSIASLIIEQMILMIAKNHGFKLLLTEHNKFIERCLKTKGVIPTKEREWSVSMSIDKLLPGLGFTSKPVDLGHWGAKKIGQNYDDYEDLTSPKKNFSNTSSEGVRYRNAIIQRVIIEGMNENCLLFVGSYHLYGLLEQTPFPKDISLLTICAENASLKKESSQLERNFALEAKHIIRPDTELDQICEFLSPEVAIEYVNNLNSAQALQRKILFFANPYNPSDLDNYGLIKVTEAELVSTKKPEIIKTLT